MACTSLCEPQRSDSDVVAQRTQASRSPRGVRRAPDSEPGSRVRGRRSPALAATRRAPRRVRDGQAACSSGETDVRACGRGESPPGVRAGCRGALKSAGAGRERHVTYAPRGTVWHSRSRGRSSCKCEPGAAGGVCNAASSGSAGVETAGNEAAADLVCPELGSRCGRLVSLKRGSGTGVQCNDLVHRRENVR